MTPIRELVHTIGEYETVLRRAGEEGWLADLIRVHTTACSVEEAKSMISDMDLPADLKLRFRKGRNRGRARYNRRTRRYGISLPDLEGTGSCRLRVGLVLHEAAHVWDHQSRRKFGHGPDFCQMLRETLEFNWEEHMPTSSYRAIYDRHRGPFSLVLTRDVIVKGKETQKAEHLRGPFSAQQAHEEACLLINDPRDNVLQVHVYSDSENQFCGAFYKRGEVYRSWEDETDGRLELSDERPAPALLREREELVQEVDDPVDGDVPTEAVLPAGFVRDLPAEKPAKPRRQPKVVIPGVTPAPRGKATKLPGDRFPVVRGRSLELDLGGANPWPRSQGATLVREYFEAPGRRATAAEVVAALGPQLKDLGVEFPGSLVSRLKQGGFLREVAA